MIPTVDIDLVAYADEILHKRTEIIEKSEIKGKIAFNVDMSQKEIDAYYMCDFRRFKRRMDDIKKTISNRKNNS